MTDPMKIRFWAFFGGVFMGVGAALTGAAIIANLSAWLCLVGTILVVIGLVLDESAGQLAERMP